MSRTANMSITGCRFSGGDKNLFSQCAMHHLDGYFSACPRQAKLDVALPPRGLAMRRYDCALPSLPDEKYLANLAYFDCENRF